MSYLARKLLGNTSTPFFCNAKARFFSVLVVGDQTYLRSENAVKSFWHDIPLIADKDRDVYNMFVEIPRWTNAKNELNKNSLFNPISQEIKNGVPRFVPDLFPYKGYIWNYGAFPQTYEDPSVVDKSTGSVGDGDPIDVLELGQSVGTVGEVKKVKLLGIMGMIDGGETDWKALTIDVSDPMASKLNDINDIEKYMPGLIDATRSWFTDYKVPQGKSQNSWAFNGQAKNRQFAKSVIDEAYSHWATLISKKGKADALYFGIPKNSSDHHNFGNSSTQNLTEESKAGKKNKNNPEGQKWFFIKDGKVLNV